MSIIQYNIIGGPDNIYYYRYNSLCSDNTYIITFQAIYIYIYRGQRLLIYISCDSAAV